MLVKNRSNGKNYYEIGNKPACVRCLTDAIGISSRTLIKYSKKDLTSVGMRGKHTHRPNGSNFLGIEMGILPLYLNKTFGKI